MDGIILDARGNPMAAPTSGKQWYTGPGDSVYRVTAPRLDDDIRRMISHYRHRIMLSDTRHIVRSSSVLAGMIQQRADMVATNLFEPFFTGSDEDWGAKASDELRKHLRYSDLQGTALRWDVAWRVMSWLLDVDGDCFRVKITDPQTGRPKIQSIEAHRVGWTGSQFLAANRFSGCDPQSYALAQTLDGARVTNGVVLGDYDQPLAYVITDGTSFSGPVALVDAAACFHVVEREWFSQSRGIPKLVYAILDWYDLKETREAEVQKQKAQSKHSISEANPTGGRPVTGINGSADIVASSSGAPVEVVDMGLIRYFKSGTGSGLTFHKSDSPGDSWQRFLREIEAGAFYALGWNRALLDPSGFNSANNHAIADLVNYSIFKRFDTLAHYARQELQWHVSGLIRLGKIPDSPEWWMWDVAQPPEYQVAQARNNAATIDAIRAGIETHPRVIKAKGGDPDKWLTEQAQFVKKAMQIAEREGVPFDLLVQTRKPGDQVITDNQQPA